MLVTRHAPVPWPAVRPFCLALLVAVVVGSVPGAAVAGVSSTTDAPTQAIQSTADGQPSVALAATAPARDPVDDGGLANRSAVSAVADRATGLAAVAQSDGADCPDGFHAARSMTESVPVAGDGGLCVWERAILPLRTADEEAPTSVPLPSTFVTVGGASVPVNVQALGVYRQGEPLSMTFESVAGANTERFAGEDVSLVVLRTAPNVTDSSSLALGASSLAGLRSQRDATVVEVLDDDAGVGAVADDGSLTVSYTPPRPGVYTFALVRTGAGDAVQVTDDGRLDVRGSPALLGVETAPVATAASETQPVDATISAGDDLAVEVDSTLGEGPTRHLVVLFDPAAVDDQFVELVVDGSPGDRGSLSPDDVTVRTSVSSIGGVLTVDADGADGTPGRSLGGELDVEMALQQIAPGVTVESTDSTVLYASATAVGAARSETTVTVGTTGAFPAGEYRYLHVAVQDDGVSTDTGTVTIDGTAD